VLSETYTILSEQRQLVLAAIIIILPAFRIHSPFCLVEDGRTKILQMAFGALPTDQSDD
jgi:hypothetical protein